MAFDNLPRTQIEAICNIIKIRRHIEIVTDRQPPRSAGTFSDDDLAHMASNTSCNIRVCDRIRIVIDHQRSERRYRLEDPALIREALVERENQCVQTTVDRLAKFDND